MAKPTQTNKNRQQPGYDQGEVTKREPNQGQRQGQDRSYTSKTGGDERDPRPGQPQSTMQGKDKQKAMPQGKGPQQGNKGPQNKGNW